MTVRYASLAINLDQRDKDGSPTIHKYPEHGVQFLAARELTNLTVSIIENGSLLFFLLSKTTAKEKRINKGTPKVSNSSSG